MLDDMMRRAAREAANPHDGRFMRFVRHMMYSSINQAITSTIKRGKSISQQAYEDDRIDEAINQSDKSKTGVTDIASLLNKQGFQTPKGMDSQEYVSRALVSIAKQFGATVDDIEKLLKTRIESTSEDGTGPDSLGFIFTDVADEIKDLTDKIEKYLNLGKIKERDQDVLKDTSEEERRKRREQEDRNRPAQQPQETSIDRALNFVASIFRKITPGAEEAYQKKIAADANNPNAEARKPLDELLKSFANFMGSPDIDESMRGGELQQAINELTGAIKDNTNAQGTQGKPPQSFSQRLLESIITGVAKTVKPLANFTQRVVPQSWQNTMNRFAGNTAARLAARAGVNPAVAARAAIAAGPLGWVVAGAAMLGHVSVAVGAVVTALRSLAQEALKTVDRVAIFNGSLMTAKTELAVGRLKRDIEMANHLEQPGAKALNMQNRMENEWLFWEKIKNDMGLAFSIIESGYFIGQAEVIKFLASWREEISYKISPLFTIMYHLGGIGELMDRWFNEKNGQDNNVMKNTDLMKFHEQFVAQRGAPQGIRQAPQLPGNNGNARQQMIGGGK